MQHDYKEMQNNHKVQNYFQTMQILQRDAKWLQLLRCREAFHISESRSPLSYNLFMAVGYLELQIAAFNWYYLIWEYLKLFWH